MNNIRAFYAGLTAQKFSLKEQTHFAKRLSFLITAGVPLAESISILQDQMRSQKRADIVEVLLQDVLSGQALSKSFAKFPRVFSEFSVHILKVGESSGTLAQSLEYLADELKKRQALRAKVVGAFIYPALITLATFGITLFLTVYLFPKIMPVFASLDVRLPLATRMMIALSGFVIHWGIFVAFFVVVISISFSLALTKSVQLRWQVDRMILHVPLFGRMIRFYNIANGCRTLGLLLTSGLVFSEAAIVTSETTKNLVYKGAFKDLSAVVTRGEKVSTYLLEHQKLFPDIAAHMVAVGERSGTLPQTLVYLSGVYDAEVEDFTKNISTLVEPVLMIVMGLMVGFIAISIITPIYGITQNLHAK